MSPKRINYLEALMPHRSKMKWVEFIELGEEKGQGNTRITLTKDSLFIIEDELASSAVIEMMAQTFGYVKGAEAKEDGFKLSETYLVAIDLFERSEKVYNFSSQNIEIRVREYNNVGSISYVAAEAFIGSSPLATAKLKCFANMEKI